VKLTNEQLAVIHRNTLTISRQIRELISDMDALGRLYEANADNDDRMAAMGRARDLLHQEIQRGVEHLSEGARLMTLHEISVADEQRRGERVSHEG
jgi:hypothetical protein